MVLCCQGVQQLYKSFEWLIDFAMNECFACCHFAFGLMSFLNIGFLIHGQCARCATVSPICFSMRVRNLG